MTWGRVAILFVLAVPTCAASDSGDAGKTGNELAGLSIATDWDLSTPDETDWQSEPEEVKPVTRKASRRRRRGPGFRPFVRVGGGVANELSFGRSNNDGLSSDSSVPVSVDIDDDDTPVGSEAAVAGITAEGNIDNAVGFGGTFIFTDLGSDDLLPTGTDLIYTDFGDLHLFNLRFDIYHTWHKRRLDTFELVAQHLWTRDRGLLNHKPAWRFNYYGPEVAVELGQLRVADRSAPSLRRKQTTNGWFAGFQSVNYCGYGIRYNAGEDRYGYHGALEVSVDAGLGNPTYGDTDIMHTTIGPQLSIGRVTSRSPWQFDLSGHLLLGYGRADFDQDYVVGELLRPQAINPLIVAQPHYGENKRDDEYFAQHAELRLTTSYFLRRNCTIDATVRGFVAGPWYDASEAIGYTLPSFTLLETSSDYLTGYNLYVGMTYLR
ncbi:MAG: hypothetical protein AAGF31_11500 [Planctomycetota bacterium]